MHDKSRAPNSWAVYYGENVRLFLAITLYISMVTTKSIVEPLFHTMGWVQRCSILKSRPGDSTQRRLHSGSGFVRIVL